MQQIQPIAYTSQGNLATQLSVTSISDNLTTSCLFNWQLFDSNGMFVDMGTITCSGTDYANWSGNNMFPYQFVAANLIQPLTLITS